MMVENCSLRYIHAKIYCIDMLANIKSTHQRSADSDPTASVDTGTASQQSTETQQQQ